MISNALMEKESDYDNDGLGLSEEYFRKKKIFFFLKYSSDRPNPSLS